MKFDKPTISPAYKQLLADMHDSRNWGTKGYKQAEFFLPFCRELGCRTILDYGSGQGSVRRHLADTDPDLDVFEYDPAMADTKPPEPAEFVICGDVMEHVEEEYVGNVLEHIYLLMTVGGYFNIATKEAKAILPDGRNAHITLYNGGWWERQLRQQPWEIVKMDIGRKCAKFYITK